MAERLEGVALPPHEMLIRRLACLTILSLFVTACGAIDYDINEKNFFASASKKKDMGTVRFHFGDSTEPVTIHARKIKGGYALQSSIYQSTDGSDVRFAASRTSQKDLFVGIEGNLKF